MTSMDYIVAGIAAVLLFIYLLYALVRGEIAGPNSWNSKGYEWLTSSPPIKENFEETLEYREEPHCISQLLARK